MSDKAPRPLLQAQNADGEFHTIETVAAWEEKRANIRSVFDVYLGSPSGKLKKPEPEFRVLDERQREGYRQLKIAYLVEPDEEVRAHLLVPERLAERAPGVLCLHGTSPEAKDTQIGLGKKPGQEYALRLVQRGFVCLCPDHLCSGERLQDGFEPYDTTPFYTRHPEWSAVGKTVWDAARALDILETLEYVDADRLGSVGHSLGGHSTMFTAAMDQRVKGAVSNCGLTLLEGSAKQLVWARDRWYRYFPKLRPLFLARTGLPFDMHEIAALIAPRAFLNISGLADAGFDQNHLLGEVGNEINGVYQLYGEGDRFGHFLFGGPHSVPPCAQQLATAWLEQHLA